MARCHRNTRMDPGGRSAWGQTRDSWQSVGTEHVVAATPVFPCKMDTWWLVCSVPSVPSVPCFVPCFVPPGNSSSISRLLGAGFGYLSPHGALGSLGGGTVGYVGAKALGYDDKAAGSAYLGGSLVGGTLGGGAAAFARQGGSLMVRGTYAAKAMGPDVILVEPALPPPSFRARTSAKACSGPIRPRWPAACSAV